MPRIRYIKPDFFKDEHLKELPFEARLLFAGLWCWADRDGRLEDRPERVKVEIMPYDQVDVEKMLEMLSQPKNGTTRPFIQRYEVAGEKYIQIISWDKHQKPHHTEKKSTIPIPPKLSLTVKKPSLTVRRRLKKEGMGMGMGMGMGNGDGKGNGDGDGTPDAPIPANAGTPQAVFVKNWSDLYQSETGHPYKTGREDFILAAKLLKDFGEAEVLFRARIFFKVCRDKSAWFAKTAGMGAFTIKNFSHKWNELTEGGEYGRQAGVSRSEIEEFLAGRKTV